MSEKWRDYSYSEKQINNMARRVVYRRISAMGAASSDTYEDIKQELAMAWLEAVEKYDPEGGASFSTFLHNGMLRHINRHIEKQYEKQLVTGANVVSLNQSVQSEKLRDCSSLTYHDLIPDDKPQVDERLEQESCYDLVTRNLSERARQFVEILRDPPLELVQALDDLSEKAAYAKSLGHNYATVKRVSANIIFNIMGARRSERDKIIKEIQSQALSIQI